MEQADTQEDRRAAVARALSALEDHLPLVKGTLQKRMELAVGASRQTELPMHGTPESF
jgi:hypothetical protein